jgi:hypothetical protein
MTETKPAPSPEQREFAAAMKRTGKTYPRWQDVIDVIEGLGYRRAGEGAAAELAAATQAWKRANQTNFPAWRVIFDILTAGIGYTRMGTTNAA